MKFPLKPPCIGNFALPELCFPGLPQKGQDLAKNLQRNLGVVLTSVAIQAVLKMEGLDSIQNGDDWGWSRVEPMVFRVYLNFGKHQPFRSGSNIGYPEISKIPWLTAKLGETIWVKIWVKQKDCTQRNALIWKGFLVLLSIMSKALPTTMSWLCPMRIIISSFLTPPNPLLHIFLLETPHLPGCDALQHETQQSSEPC